MHTHAHTHPPQVVTDPDGWYYVNRQWEMFSYVLEYLRNDRQLPAYLPEDEAELERIRRELDYFLVTAFPEEPSLTLAKAMRDFDNLSYIYAPDEDTGGAHQL